MKTNNPFDAHLDAAKNRIPEALLTASTTVADHLDLSWKIAQAVFEGKAAPEHALAIYDRLVQALPALSKPVNR